MKKYSKLFFALIALVVFVGTFVFLWQKSLPKEIRYSEFTPQKETITKSTIITGRIEPRDEDGETVEAVADFIYLGSKITADCDCSHEIKRCLPLGSKAMTNLDNILKNKHYFANRGPPSQSDGFSSMDLRVGP